MRLRDAGRFKAFPIRLYTVLSVSLLSCSSQHPGEIASQNGKEAHGYDPVHPKMHAIFLALGPIFSG